MQHFNRPCTIQKIISEEYGCFGKQGILGVPFAYAHSNPPNACIVLLTQNSHSSGPSRFASHG